MTMAAEQAVVFFAAFALYFVRFLREEELRERDGHPDDDRPQSAHDSFPPLLNVRLDPPKVRPAPSTERK